MQTNWIKREQQHSANNYHPLPVVLTKGEGVWLTDIDGKPYLDMMSAYSAANFGHSHPRLVKALQNQAGRLAITSRAFHHDQLAPFLEAVSQTTGFEKVLPMNSGAEAVETAIKAARKWAYQVKKVAPNQAQIIVAKNNFSGRTTTIISFSSEPQYRQGFGPFTTGFIEVPFGDAQALEEAITENTAAFLVEPIQGEAGIIVPPEGYLTQCRKICDRHNVLLLCDEIQTGLGRTGKMLCSEYDAIKADGIMLGKALGGGLLPVSAFVARSEVMDVFTPGDHGSTFGGNPLAAAVGKVALQVLQEEDLVANAQRQGMLLLQSLQKIRHPGLLEVRGKGLMLALELDPKIVSARTFCERLMQQGMLTKDTHNTVVRLAPPLIINSEQIEMAVIGVQNVFSTL